MNKRSNSLGTASITDARVAGRPNLLVGWALLLCSPSTLHAAEWTFDPAVALALGYETNAALSTAPYDSASSVHFLPSANFRRRTETSEVNVGLLARATRYSTSAIENTDEEQVALSSFSQITERARLGLDGVVRWDSLFESAVIGSGTGNIQDVDIGLVTTKVRRNWREIQPSATYATTERSSVSFRYRLTDVAFAEEAGTGLVDYQQHYLSATYSYRMTVVDDLFLVAQGSQFRPSAGNESNNAGLLAGISHKFSETLSSGILAGVGKTTEKQAIGGDVDNSSLVLQAHATQQAEISRLDAVISRDVQPSGSGRSTSTDQVRVHWDRKLSQTSSLILRTTIFRNQVLEGSDPAIDRLYGEVEAGMRWALAPEWALHIAYQYRHQEYDAALDSAQSSGVFASVSWTPPRR